MKRVKVTTKDKIVFVGFLVKDGPEKIVFFRDKKGLVEIHWPKSQCEYEILEDE